MFKKVKKINKSNIDKNKIIQRVILFTLLLITSSSFFYLDINSNIRQGMNFWKALFEGNLFQYYSINIASKEAGEMVHEANYDMIMNFFMGIWELPLYIIERVTGGNILTSFGARVWGKLYLLVATWIAGEGLKKVAREMGVEEQHLENIFFMFCSSAMLLFSTCVVGQADIVTLIFTIYAFYYLFKGENWKFVLCFVLAAQCKNFALFIFIPVILYKEKRIWKIAVECLLPVVVSYLVEKPFKHFDPVGVHAKKPRFWSMIGTMLEHRINLFGIDVPVLLIGFVAICILAYLMKPVCGKSVNNAQISAQIKSAPTNNASGTLNKNTNQYAIWCLLWGYLGILDLFISMYTYPYWLLYLLPFTILFFFVREDKIFARWLVECAVYFSVIVGFMVEFTFIFGTDSMSGMLPDKIKAIPSDYVFWMDKFSEFVTTDVYYNAWALSYAVFFVGVILQAVSIVINLKKCASYGFARECISLNKAEVSNKENINKENANKGSSNKENINKENNDCSPESYEKVYIETWKGKQITCDFRVLLWIRAIAGFLLCNVGVILYFLGM